MISFATQARSAWACTMSAILMLLPLVAAQVPSNASLPFKTGDLQFNVYYSLNNNTIAPFPIVASANPGEDNNLPVSDAANNYNVTGNLTLTTPTNYSALTSSSIAYISCDGGDYPGNINATSLVSMVIHQFNPSGGSAGTNGVIILYSQTAAWCSMEVQGVNVFTMTSAANSSALLSLLQSPGNSNDVAWVANQEFSTNSGAIAYQPTAPSTTIAMIVLYSITGVITFLFLLIIVLGAVRAHRHPERYGPRNVIGMPRQSRAKGMARALLDTIPIVKFGEGEEVKPADGAHDVELADRVSRSTNHGPAIATVGPSTSATGNDEVSKAVDEKITRTIPASDLVERPAEVPGATTVQIEPPSVSGISQSEDAVQCPICTEDFVRGEPARVLPCKHNYHPACIDPWLLNVSSTCPLCRVDLNPPKESREQAEADAPTSEGSSRGPTTSRWTRIGRLGFLDSSRMQAANPEERIEALRQVREERRIRGHGAGDATEGRTRRRDRLSRLLHHDRSNRLSTAETLNTEAGMTETSDRNMTEERHDDRSL